MKQVVKWDIGFVIFALVVLTLGIVPKLNADLASASGLEVLRLCLALALVRLVRIYFVLRDLEKQ